MDEKECLNNMMKSLGVFLDEITEIFEKYMGIESIKFNRDGLPITWDAKESKPHRIKADENLKKYGSVMEKINGEKVWPIWSKQLQNALDNDLEKYEVFNMISEDDRLTTDQKIWSAICIAEACKDKKHFKR